MNKNLSAAAVCLAATLSFPAAGAEEMRPYVSGGLGYVVADDNRNSDDGVGAFFGAGRALNQRFGMEISAFYDSFDSPNAAGAEWREFGGKLDGLMFFSRNSSFSPYLGAGLGFMRSNLKTLPRGSSSDPTADVGLGFFSYFGDYQDLGLRGDVRYRWVDADGLPAGVATSFGEPVVRLGVVIPLGPRASATLLAPVAAAAAAIPAGAAVSPGKVAANDGDGDGVLDDVDNCPGTPAGWLVDAKGCPVDSDRDGVPDNLDKCPGTAAGISVDAKGCPTPSAQAGAARNFENVNFAFDKAELTDYASALLDNAANVIGSLVQKYPNLKVDVSGHTDWMGTDAYNQALSERRANMVKEYLTRKGVDAGRISSFAYGETRPVAPNDTEEGRALNRRSEVRTRE